MNFISKIQETTLGFYIRKAISVGPIRFNLSKSGIGVSAGIKGLRFGTGPRGNYIHMGRGGLYYKKTFPTNNGIVKQPRYSENYQEDSSEPLVEIESGDISQMFDSSSADLVAEMNEKQKILRLMPIVLSVGVIISFFTFINSYANLVFILTIILTAISSYAAFIKDDLRKSTVLFYELEPDIEVLFQKLHDSFNEILTCRGIWHVEAEGTVVDSKRNAGATSLIKRTAISLSKNNPPFVKTNISTPSIPVGKQTMYFFPDKILFFENDKVGAISYENLIITIESTRFIESDTVPSDATIVDKTWKYVNKKGGPDKRFNDNRELPIVLYEDINFKSHTGLNERIEVSKANISEALKEAIYQLSKIT